MVESSLPELLRERARLQPDDTAFTYIDYDQDSEGVSESLTWSGLYRRTSNVARELRSCGARGDRAVILAPQGTEYLVAFLGALQAGQIAVPLPLPLPGSGDERVRSVLLDASPSAILTTSAVVSDIVPYVGPTPTGDAVSILEVDLLDLDSDPGPAEADNVPFSVAHLQYTSGSTRTPAGVMVSHENIRVNCEQIMSAWFEDGIAPLDTTVVSWLPFFHDMGLVLGMAFPVFSGFRTVLTSPPAFLQRPARWMQMLAGNSHAFSAGPNIAFELAAARTSDADLSGLDLGGVLSIASGAERVNPPTLRRFAERFAPFNLHPEALRPSYGLAEATLYVATREPGQPSETVFFEAEKLAAGEAERCAADEGTPLVSYTIPKSPLVRIVDPETRIECRPGTIGEIWVHGDNVCDGYWQKPEETERTFGATLVGAPSGTPEAPWLRTGDLGFFSGDEMFIVGRIKDLLIVYGRNHAPDDIEATIQEITAGRVVAVAVPGEDGVENLVTIVEFKLGKNPEEAAERLRAAKRKITSAISRSHGLGVTDVVMVPPHSIPLTTSGKVRRRDTLQLFLRGELTRLDDLIPPPPPPVADVTPNPESESGWEQRLRSLRQQQNDVLVDLVRSQVASVLGNISPDEVDPELTFQDLGFDSVKATGLIDRLKNVTALALPPTLAFDHPTPNALATQLGQLFGGSVASSVQLMPHEASTEPIAVVGMACRFPGGVESTAGLWDVVATGRDVLGEFPPDRGWNLADLFDPDPDAVGKTYTRFGGFLAEAADFDAEFFGISGREALSMDPQQRLLLEVCWEALEKARIDPTSLAGSRTGVFVGMWSQAYGAGGSDGAEGYALTGLSTSVASGRISYTLGLQGPAITVDTACSSSLVATHLACQSLQKGESSLALAGGVTVMTTPSVFTEFARQRGLAADGRCKAFSANADGTGWGEGAAVLVLERLSEAKRNNHPVLAVIAGSAVNQDGASNGLAAPNGPAQQRVIVEAAANAGVGLDQVDVVEAHGTGTMLGDPIEAGALIATYGAAHTAEHPLWLGSIKSNIGHTQAAAGVAGIIKMVEALNHDSLPPTLHVDRPTPNIDWSAGTVRLLTEPEPWPTAEHPRTAAVSSFGISGTNAHVILRQAPAAEPVGPTDDGVGFQLRMWPISARTPAALFAQADRLHRLLADNSGLDLTDVAYSLGATRAHHPYRAVITVPAESADVRDDLLSALDALRTDQQHPQVIRHHRLARRRGKTVFVLPGQGAQYPGMGWELYENNPVFAQSVDACDAALRAVTGWSVRDVLRQDPSAPALDRVDVVQPVLFTMMVSLSEMLASYGIVADAVIGHSQGEIAAAYIAGALSLSEAATVVARRSQALSALRGTGGMASVLMAAEQVGPLLQPWGEALSIAAVNGPSHTIISGDPTALEEFSAVCERDGIHIRSIAVDYASHSAQVEPARERMLGELADLKPSASRIPLYSTVGGAGADPLDTTTMTADYWYRNLREPVRFHDRVVELLAAGECTFVELSPHPGLAPAISDTLAQADGRAQSAVVITLHRDTPAQDSLSTALAQLHNHGHSPSWSALYPRAHSVELPTYPFEHRRYWLASAPGGDASGLGLDRVDHPLLGAVATLADKEQLMITARLSPATLGWLAGDQVHDTPVFSPAGVIEVMLGAGELSGCPVIDELVIEQFLTLSQQSPTDLQILVQPFDQNGRRSFTVHARSGGGHSAAWTLYASGVLGADPTAAPPVSIPAPHVEALNQDDFYDRLTEQGLHYSGLFRSLRGTGTEPARPEVSYAEVALPAGTDVDGYGIHPALLDAALQPLAFISDDSAGLRLPYAFTGVTLYATAATQLYVRLTRTGEDTFELLATDTAGAPVITIDELTLGAVPTQIGDLTRMAGLSDSLFELTWRSLPDPRGASAQKLPTWAVCTDSPDRLPDSLSSGAIHCDLATDLATLTPCPDLVIWPLPLADETTDKQADPLPWVHTLTRHVVAQLQNWLARPETANSQLVILTRHAASVSADDTVPDLAHAAAWALIHAAQNEHPGRIVLIDTDDTASTAERILVTASAGPSGEPQLALRDGVTHVPRLARLARQDAPVTPPVLDADGTALITGGTGTLGAIFAEHLVTRYGVKHLLLLSRRGPDAPGTAELREKLVGLGAEVAIVACDSSNPAELTTVLGSISENHPLTVVIHAAGILDDALLTDMSAEQLDAVLSAKADAAWHLHRLTTGSDLAAFVMFSSAAGVLGSPGQANYAAANAFLDALAHQRHQTNRPATSMAWGYWQTQSGMTAHLATADLTRLASAGLTPLTAEHGVALFDAALASHAATVVASPISTITLARLARQHMLDPMLSGLTHVRPRAAAASPRSLATRLAGESPAQRLSALTEIVTATIASVLAHPDPASLDPDRPFQDLGIDSLTALALRNSLTEQTGLVLPATLALDHPTPAAVAKHLAGLFEETASAAAPAVQTATNVDAPVGNTLAYLDQAAFVALRAVHQALIQVTWVYNRAVDVDGLRRFHQNLGYGLLGRRIERSPVPFARDHWVAAPASADDIDFAPTARPRAEINAWADERVRLPIDPEWGPGWHLGVLPLEDGGTAVSLVVTHTIVDAIGFLEAITDAAEGRRRDLGYPAAGSRTLMRAVREDLRKTIDDLPDVAHALAAAARRGRRDRKELKSSIKAPPSPPEATGNDPLVEVPALIAYVDLADWDARAKSLGGTSNSLAAGIASRLAVLAGRVKDDGTVTLRFSISLRTEGDTRGNALTAVDITVDPSQALTDLGEMQAEITQGILTAMEDPDNEWLAPLPLAAMTPRWALRKIAGMALGGSTLPVTCSNVGELSAAANRPDGTDADHAYVRNLEPDMKLSVLEAMGGQLFLASGRGREKAFLRVSGYIPGRLNAVDDLQELVSLTLAEFDLTAEFDH